MTSAWAEWSRPSKTLTERCWLPPITATRKNGRRKTGQPYTAHTVGDVQAVLVNGPKDVAALNNGKLADISPTLLDLLGIKQPAEMTGKSLLVRK